MMSLIHRFCAAAMLSAWFIPAWGASALYWCVDEDGHKTASSSRLAGQKCTVINLRPETDVPATPPARTATPANFPKVEEDAQKARDDDRRRILENELQAEQRNLEQAKKDLAEQESIRLGNERNYQRVLDRLEPYKNKAALHERNIEAIEKDLAKLR